MPLAAATNQGETTAEAIDVDAENATPEITTVDKESDIRTSVEDSIAERLRLQQEAENAEVNPDGEAETVTETAAATEAAPDQPAAPVAPAQPEMVIVKVEGQQYSVPKTAIDEAGSVEAFQKRAAADIIFRRAKEREDAANKLLAAARQPAAQTTSNQDASTQDQEAELVEKYRFEADPKAAADAIRKLAGQQNPLTADQIGEIVQIQLSQNEAVTRFKTDYPDIVKDPILLGIAQRMENNQLSAGRKDYGNILTEVGKAITDWKNKLVPAATGVATAASSAASAAFDAKRDKKSTIVNIPQAKAKATMPEQPREPTHSEIIEEERKLRDRGR